MLRTMDSSKVSEVQSHGPSLAMEGQKPVQAQRNAREHRKPHEKRQQLEVARMGQTEYGGNQQQCEQERPSAATENSAKTT